MPAQLLLDPWPPDYDAPIQTDGPELVSVDSIDPYVETSEWKPIRPDAGTARSRIYFVDGVRRIEARILSSEDDGTLVHGMFASTGAGSVLSEGGRASYDHMDIHRYLILGSGRSQPEKLRTGTATIEFEGIAIAGNTPDDLLNCLQNLMRESEAAIAEELTGPDSCVFADGPLTYFSTATEALVGVVKRIFLPYLSSTHFALVSQLAAGERTPIFAILDGKHDRYSWFQRLANPRAVEHRLAGIVRLEVRATAGFEMARELANFATNRLPAFASTAVRDPRAPQNLVPVGALEEQLRHRLGDALAIRRAIEKRIHSGTGETS